MGQQLYTGRSAVHQLSAEETGTGSHAMEEDATWRLKQGGTLIYMCMDEPQVHGAVPDAVDVQGAFGGWTVMLNIDHARDAGFRRLLQSGGAKVCCLLSNCLLIPDFKYWFSLLFPPSVLFLCPVLTLFFSV